MEELKIEPVAIVRSPYKQKFAIPRQPNLVREAIGELVFSASYADPNTLRGLEDFSHLWLIFVFHDTMAEGWNPLISPPRLGGKEKRGVFATRSSHRPNPIGMSVVEFLDWKQDGPNLCLRVKGIDLLDGTPILDIKPYLPYADIQPKATGGFAPQAPELKPVRFSKQALEQIDQLSGDYPDLGSFIESVLAQDPRPAWRQQDADAKQYGMSLYDLNIKWRNEDGVFLVLSVLHWNDDSPVTEASMS